MEPSRDRHTFFHLREDGGTKISSAFKCARDLLDMYARREIARRWGADLVLDPTTEDVTGATLVVDGGLTLFPPEAG